MILNYRDPKIIPYIQFNLYQHNTPAPLYLERTEVGKYLSTLTPIKVVELGAYDKVEENIAGNKQFEVKNYENKRYLVTKGIPFLTAEGTSLANHSVCKIPGGFQIGIHPVFLMPILTKQPTTIEEACEIIKVDPRFIAQFDAKICKEKLDCNELVDAALKGIDGILAYQRKINPQKSSSISKEEVENRKLYAQQCYKCNDIFASKVALLNEMKSIAKQSVRS